MTMDTSMSPIHRKQILSLKSFCSVSLPAALNLIIGVSRYFIVFKSDTQLCFTNVCVSWWDANRNIGLAVTSTESGFLWNCQFLSKFMHNKETAQNRKT